MLKKTVALFTAALMLTTTLAGFTSSAKSSSSVVSPKATTQTKLTFFSGTVELVSFWNKFFAKYNSTNKDGITVDQEYSKEATNALQIKMASGDVPDLISCSVTQDMIDAKKFVDLTHSTLWNNLSADMKNDSYDVKSGKTYCVPYLKTQVGLLYNKTIFKKLGLKQATTWAQFVANLKIIKKKMPSVTPFYIGAKDGWMLNQMAQFTMMAPAMQKLSYVKQQKAMLSADFATLGWNTKSTGIVATFAKDLLGLQKDGLVNSNIVTATYDNQTTAFAQGKAAFICQGLWAVSNIAKIKKNTSFVGITYYPTMVSGSKAAIGSAPDGDIYLSSGSKSVSAAKKVLAYIMQAANLKSVSEAKSEPSPNPKVSSNWGVLKSDVASITNNKNIAKLTWAASISGFSGDDQGKMIQELFAGGFSSPTAFATSWLATWKKGCSK